MAVEKYDVHGIQNRNLCLKINKTHNVQTKSMLEININQNANFV